MSQMSPARPWPRPVDVDVPFAALDQLGNEVALRRPETGESLCTECADAVFADPQDIRGTTPAADAAGTSSVAPRAAGAAPTDLDDLLRREIEAFDLVFPTAGELEHRCDLRFGAPLWIVRDERCHQAALSGRDLGGHFDLHDTCMCGPLDLIEAIEHLSGDQRQAAVAAHVSAMNHAHAHLLAAESCISGIDLDETLLTAACLQCLSEPHRHADDLDDEVSRLSHELGVVLRDYQVTILVGPERDPDDFGA